ncbi:hypothetical protein FOA52_008177 [Chlamydomonas sp. UWO 241]|nr:hypothetical protein FOA52_008177 [Chlamydomonas sp. UWO 241]
MGLFGLLLLSVIVVATYSHWAQTQHLHHIHSISSGDHHRFWAMGVHCEFVIETQSYDTAPELMRRYSLTDAKLAALNPGQPVSGDGNYPPDTHVCVRGETGSMVDLTAMAWFWPCAASACGVAGFAVSFCAGRQPPQSG